LEIWLAWQIAGVYHAQSHATLKVSPLEAWREGTASMNQTIRHPKDAKASRASSKSDIGTSVTLRIIWRRTLRAIWHG
jgi:hypothetical protein